MLSSKNFHMRKHKTTHLRRVSILSRSRLRKIRSIPEMGITANKEIKMRQYCWVSMLRICIIGTKLGISTWRRQRFFTKRNTGRSLRTDVYTRSHGNPGESASQDWRCESWRVWVTRWLWGIGGTVATFHHSARYSPMRKHITQGPLRRD